MSGEEAVRIYAQRHPNAVLLDVRLPDKDGVQALDEIRHIDPHGRVAIVSALGRSEVVRRAIAAGASDYILKPLDMDRVLQAVEDLCA
jgi:two-component system chemotaxis response regulator CheY